ncbi:MAG TPA: lipid II flippase MurJ [Anaerolineales bacterium]|nr:lipid II flippase MurJ [Anaerolineales bacterium]
MKKLTFLTRTSILLFFLFGLDKALAFLRSIIVTRQFQLSAQFDAFNSANNLPDLLYALISGGTLAMALIPVLTETLDKEDRRALWDVFSRIANLFFLTAAGVAALIAIFAKPIVESQIGIVPGFTPEQHLLVANLMRLNLIATLIFAISGLVMSGLQANQHFVFPALAPVLYNVGQIFGALVLAPTKPYSFGPITLPAFGLGIHGLVYGVIIGAVLHLSIQIPGLVKYQFHWIPSIDLKDRRVRQVLKLIGPRLITMFFIQATFIARDNLASRLPGAGAISALAIGWMIMQVPETLIGTAIGTALLPTISGQAAESDWEAFRGTIERAVRVLVAVCLPVTAILAAVIHPLVRTVFGLDAAGTTLLTWTVRVYLLALTGESVLEVAARAFYARQDALRPLAASFINTTLFIGGGALILLRFPGLGAPGIALIELAFTIEATILLVWLNRLLPAPVRLGSSLWRGLAAALIGGAAAYGLALELPLSATLSSLVALPLGTLVALPFIWKEVRLLFRL